MNLSDITFPNYVTGIMMGTGAWLKGGYDYQTQAPGWTRYFVVKETLEYNLNELTYNLDGNVLTSDPFTVFTHANGYEIKMQIIQGEQTPQGGTPISVIWNWYDKDGNVVGDIPNVYGGQGRSYWTMPVQWGNVNDGSFKMFIFLNTVYFPDANPPEGTDNHGLEIDCVMGSTEWGFSFDVGSHPLVVDGFLQPVKRLGVITDLEAFAAYLHAHGDRFTGDPFTDEPDPGEPAGGGDTSGTGGGGGNYDPTSDPVDFPNLPTGGALTSGMIKGFVMNSGNLIGLQQKLWDMSIFDIATQFQKLVNQPLDCIISLHCLPFIPTEGSPEEIKLGSFPTTIQANRVSVQYMEIDAGSITVKEFWGSALDYAPYTQVEIFIPFVGFRNLQIEDIQGLTLSMKYHVDVLTGDCVAYLKCGQSVLYSWTGNCLAHIPCTANSSDLLAKNISAVGAVGLGLATGNPASAAAGAMAGAVNTATAKNHVQRSGDVAGSPGLMSEFTPYLVFHRPKQSLAKNYNQFKGYPANITYKLSTLQGYTEVEHVHLTGIKATDTELQEIEDLLKSGVII